MRKTINLFLRYCFRRGQVRLSKESRKDDFWGAMPKGQNTLVGMNVLGRLLMELREEVRQLGAQLLTVPPLDIPDFLFFSRPIGVIEGALPRPAFGRASASVVRHVPPENKPDVTVNEIKTRKKLIEISIPLEAINAASAKEKSVRQGHPSSLHLWWARRPLAACRAVLFAQLVDDPSSWPEKFGNDEAKIEVERKRLHKVIADMVEWPDANPADQALFERAIEDARWEIARSVAWGLGEEPPLKNNSKAILEYLRTKAPPVYDPFSGGGSIPFEAQRLGLRAYGSDLNPVAVLIGKALVEIPSRSPALRRSIQRHATRPNMGRFVAGMVRRVLLMMCAITATVCVKKRKNALDTCIRRPSCRMARMRR